MYLLPLKQWIPPRDLHLFTDFEQRAIALCIAANRASEDAARSLSSATEIIEFLCIFQELLEKLEITIAVIDSKNTANPIWQLAVEQKACLYKSQASLRDRLVRQYLEED